MSSSNPPRLRQWLGRHPLRASLRIAAVILGVGGTAWMLSGLWPTPDQIDRAALPRPDDPTTLAPYPAGAVTVLIIGVDADNLRDLSNQAAPQGPANADALVLVRIRADAPLQVLQVPTELAVQTPDSSSAVPLGSLWQRGGTALVGDTIRELVGLPEQEPQRYVVIPRGVIRRLVDGLGELDVTLTQAYAADDRSQDFAINLQAGRQRLDGAESEQLLRHLESNQDRSQRRDRQQLVLRALVEQLRTPAGLRRIKDVLNTVHKDVDSNLTAFELLSLTAAVIGSPEPMQLSQLELAPRIGTQPLRQLSATQTRPLWPAATPAEPAP